MELTVDHLAGGVAVLRCAGRLTVTASGQLSAAVDDCLAAGTAQLVVDLSETAFVDSSGLGALVAGLKQARLAGGDLHVASAGEQVTTVLALTNLDRVLAPYPSVEEACHHW